jgi:hypothetical protein
VAVNASIKVVKTMPFKGGTRTWSNRYHFNGGTPADATHWLTLMDNVTTAEKTLYGGQVHIVEALGYAAGSEVPVASKVYSLAGTLTPAANGTNVPGEVCGLLRYSTAARSTKNHPIYAFNYFHASLANNTSFSTVDLMDANQKSAMATYATSWISGFSDGTITAVRATPAGHACTGQVVEEYLTHRDFPYTSSV